MMLSLPAGILALLALTMTAMGDQTREATARECMPHSDAHGLMWWMEGFPGTSRDCPWLQCVQTGRYALALDVERMQVTHLGLLGESVPYAEAALQGNGVVSGLPPADLELSITVHGRRYRCVKGGTYRSHAGPRLIESGRFLQRCDITDLRFEDDEGNALGVEAYYEMVAWPDRLNMLLQARPALQPIGAGPSFGRVGGGYSFDGSNHLETPHSPALEPEQMTLEMWVYVPEGPAGTRHYPWLVCKSGNEWVDGHWGLALINGAPTAFLNIGGGRENTHIVSSKADDRRGPIGDEALSREKWHHVAMTYDGITLRLLVDGVERGSTAVGKARSRGAGDLAFGKRQDNAGDGYHFRGILDEVRLYDRALTAEEIKAHWQSPESVTAGPDAVGQWCFDPAGLQSLQRPSEQWHEGAMRIQLTSQGSTATDEVVLDQGETWTRSQTKCVAIGLEPRDGQMVSVASRRPAVVTAATIPDAKPCAVSYDEARDWYRIDLDGVEPQGSHNDSLERVKLALENPEERPRAFHLLFDKSASGFRVRGVQAITGLSPMLRDLDGNPVGIPVQISKNWHRQPDLELKYQGVWLHGATLLRVPARSRVELELSVAYAHWGGVAAASHAQLCLIGWGGNQRWDEAAMGSWGENICFDPDQAQVGNMVCDVRPLMVHQMGQDEPRKWAWTNNVGGADFLRYFDASGRRQPVARVKAAYLRHGPNLTEVTYTWRSADGAIENRVTASLHRSDDIVRGTYRVRMDVNKPIEPSRLVIFQVGADTYSYTGERKMAVGNEEGLLREWDTQWGGEVYRTEPVELAGRTPWVSLHEAVSRDRSKAGAWANRGIILRHWEAQVGGRPATPWMAEFGVKARGTDTSTADILLPPNTGRLVPGDYVEAIFEHVVMPQYARDYYGPNENLRKALLSHENTWQMIHREATGNTVQVQVARGALRRPVPMLIQADESNQARFTITGGLGYVPITIGGLSDYRDPVLQVRQAGGAWATVDQAVHGKDFWQTDYDPLAERWQITYTVPMDTPGDARQTRELRFRVGESAWQ